MVAMTTTDVLHEMTGRIVEGFHPLRILLFGSRARGDQRWDSDYDLLVVMPDGIDRWKAGLAMQRALKDMPVPKEVLVTTEAEIAARGDLPGGVLRAALREGVTVYSAT